MIEFFQPQSKQDKICDEIYKIHRKDINDTETAKGILHEELRSISENRKKFIIGNEIKAHSADKEYIAIEMEEESQKEKIPPSTDKEDRYYRLFFHDARMDESYIQITPMYVFRNGILKVDKNGNFSIPDNDYSPMDVNSDFIFKNEKIELQLDCERMEQKQRSVCNVM